MKHKLIIMVSAPLTKRWAANFCTDELSQRFDLEYWDCSAVVYPPFKGEALERDYVRKPASMEEFKDMLRALPKDTLIVSDIHLVKQNYAFHKYMSRQFKNRIYVNFWSNIASDMDNAEMQPKALEKKSLKQRIYQIGWLQVLIKFIRLGGGERFLKFYAMHKEIERCDKVIREEKDCENLYTNHIITCLPHQKYTINHPDYEKYLQLKDGKRLIEEPFIVFIDEFYPYHPDFKEINPEMDCDKLATIYYRSMNHFFDEVEKRTGMKVVIAAHPIADYSDNPYNGRALYQYKTAELVRDCEYVCMHNSFCISYVALFDKPVCFVINEAIKGSEFGYKGICALADKMLMQVTDSDRIDETKDVFAKLPKDRREIYINRFFDTSIKQCNADLFEQYLNQIYNEIQESRNKQ